MITRIAVEIESCAHSQQHCHAPHNEPQQNIVAHAYCLERAHECSAPDCIAGVKPAQHVQCDRRRQHARQRTHNSSLLDASVQFRLMSQVEMKVSRVHDVHLHRHGRSLLHQRVLKRLVDPTLAVKLPETALYRRHLFRECLVPPQRASVRFKPPHQRDEGRERVR